MRRSPFFRRIISALALGGLLAVGQVSGAGLAAGASSDHDDYDRYGGRHHSWIDTDTDLRVYSSRLACARVRADHHWDYDHYDRYNNGDSDRYNNGDYDRYGNYDRYNNGDYDRYGNYDRYGDDYWRTPRGSVSFYLVGYGSARTYLRDGKACIYLSRNLRDGVYRLVARYNGDYPFEPSWDSEYFRVGHHRYGDYDNGYDNNGYDSNRDYRY